MILQIGQYEFSTLTADFEMYVLDFMATVSTNSDIPVIFFGFKRVWLNLLAIFLEYEVYCFGFKASLISVFVFEFVSAEVIESRTEPADGGIWVDTVSSVFIFDTSFVVTVVSVVSHVSSSAGETSDGF